jgi:hypothetical protein
MRYTEHIEYMGKSRIKYKILIDKYQGKTKLGRLSLQWEDNIKKNIFRNTVKVSIELNSFEMQFNGGSL